jgi:pilus assembly protein Flp/PilA
MFKQNARSKPMKTLIKRFVNDDSGVTAIEYGLIAALVAVGLIVGATALGTALNTEFNDLAGKVKVN